MKKIVYVLLSVVFLFLATASWYAWRWQCLFVSAKPRPAYAIYDHGSDTLLIAFIGDSWAALHSTSRPDSAVSAEWTALLGRPVKYVSCGMGGANSGDIYRLMFHQGLPIDSFSSKSLLQQRPDYGVVSAGINDANQNLGVKAYCANYHLILRHLLRCDIRPVVLEMPDVDLKSVYGKKSLKDWASDAYKAFLARTGLYHVAAYRAALRQYLVGTGLMDSVLYVSCESWNPKGYCDTALYLPDRIHLNSQGYDRLDSCMISMIKTEQP